MITQTQFPFEALIKTAMSNIKLFGILLLTALVLGGVYLIVNAIKRANDNKLVQDKAI